MTQKKCIAYNIPTKYYKSSEKICIAGQQTISMKFTYRLCNNKLYAFHRMLGKDYTLDLSKFQIPINLR